MSKQVTYKNRKLKGSYYTDCQRHESKYICLRCNHSLDGIKKRKVISKIPFIDDGETIETIKLLLAEEDADCRTMLIKSFIDDCKNNNYISSLVILRMSLDSWMDKELVEYMYPMNLKFIPPIYNDNINIIP